MGQDKERKLQNNPSSQRVNKLLKNLAQIEKRIRNIENSRMRATVKARYLAMLERNRVMILNQIGALNQTGSTTDTTAPIITTLSVSSITSQRATLSAIVNENGIGYWVVLPSGSVAPSATQVQNGQNASGIMVSLR